MIVGSASWSTGWRLGFASVGFGSGALGGVLVTVLVAMAGGAVGPGRMADVGADLLPTLLAATLSLGLGGLLGGVATWWARRVRAGR